MSKEAIATEAKRRERVTEQHANDSERRSYTKKYLFFGGIAQLGEHLLCKQGVRSSNLLTSTKI